MSAFPVEDQNSTIEAVNYLLSGPGGLGQNFEGFSAYEGAYLTGTFREPFSVPLTTTDRPTWYVSPVTITNIVLPENPGRFLYITLSGWVGASPPFDPGDTVIIADVVDDEAADFYNDTYNRSVVSCTSTLLILQTSRAFLYPAYVSGGNVSKNLSNAENSTDCNGRVTVYGPTDRAFLSAQLNVNISYTASMASEFDVIARINRYRGTPTSVAGDSDYSFDLDTNPVVSEQTTHYSVVTNGSTGNQEYIFTTVLDQPSFGFYWYILDVIFATLDPTIGGLLPQNMGSTAVYTYSGTAATQAATTTYNAITPTTLTGSGSGAVIRVQLLEGPSTAYSEETTRIRITTSGSDYEVGDTIKILGTSLGGTSPANDMILTIQAINPQPYPGDALPNVATAGLRSFTAQVIKQ
jgi:hypothetical protein